jgi:hypothetical protein
MRRMTRIWGLGCVLTGVHCGHAQGAGGPEGVAPDGAPNSAVGRFGFDVKDAVVDTTQAHSQCGWEEVLPDGSYAAVAVILADQLLNGYCGGEGAQPIPGHPFVNIQLAGPTYATQGLNLPDGQVPAALEPGQYTIANEGVYDDQICSVRGTGGSALVDVGNWGDGGGPAQPVATAVSGTVTLTSVGSGYVAGTFDVVVAPPLASGNLDVNNEAALSGTFSAKACPLVTR